MENYSIKQLRKLGQVPARTHDGWYGRLVGRRISIYFTRLLLPLGVTPNQATLLSIGFGVAGGILLAFNRAGLSLIGVLLLQLWFVFDCVDGELARIKKQSSINGLFLDLVGHCVVDPSTFICLAFAAYQGIPRIGIFALAFSASMSMFLNKQLDLGCQDSAIIEVYKKRLGKTDRSVPTVDINDKPNLSSHPKSSKLKIFLSYFLIKPFNFTIVVNLVTVIVLITVFVPSLNNMRPFLYLILLSFYGLLFPLHCVYHALRIVKRGEIRNRYLQLFGKFTHPSSLDGSDNK